MERRISGRSSGCVRGGENGWEEEEVKGRGAGVRDWKTESADGSWASVRMRSSFAGSHWICA